MELLVADPAERRAGVGALPVAVEAVEQREDAVVPARRVLGVRCREPLDRSRAERPPEQMDDAEISHVAPTRGTTTAERGDTSCWICGTVAAPHPRYPGSGLHRCPACGFGFLPESSAEDAREFYSARYFEDYSPQGGYDERVEYRRHDAAVRADLVASVVPPPAGLLEIGCASGYFLEEAVRRGYDAEGIEPSSEQAADARRRAEVPVFAGTIAAASLPDGTLDLACGWHVLEHVVRPVEALSALRSALKPGGALVIEVPNAESMAAKHLGHKWLHLDLPHHVCQFGPQSLRLALAEAGFGSVTTSTVSGWTYALPSARRTPKLVAAQAHYLAMVRTPLHRAHASRHELLRAIARVPS